MPTVTEYDGNGVWFTAYQNDCHHCDGMHFYVNPMDWLDQRCSVCSGAGVLTDWVVRRNAIGVALAFPSGIADEISRLAIDPVM